MVDVAYFRKVIPNYVRPRINELAQSTSSYFFNVAPDAVKSKGLEPKALSDGDLMICSQTVYGWSFGNKQWRRFSSPCALSKVRANVSQSGICGG